MYHQGWRESVGGASKVIWSISLTYWKFAFLMSRAVTYDPVEHHRSERRMGCEQHHVAGREAVDRLLVGVEPQEAPLRGHVDLLLERCVQRLQAGLEAILEEIRHGVELDRAPRRRKRIADSARAPAAAADQRQPGHVVLAGMHQGYSRLGESRRQDASGLPDQLTPGPWFLDAPGTRRTHGKFLV